MNKRVPIGVDKRMPLAMVLMAFVLTLLASQHLSMDRGASGAGRSSQSVFAAAPAGR